MKKYLLLFSLLFISVYSYSSIDSLQQDIPNKQDSTFIKKGDLKELSQRVYESFNLYLKEDLYFLKGREHPRVLILDDRNNIIGGFNELDEINRDSIQSITISYDPFFNTAVYGSSAEVCLIKVILK